MADVLGNEPRSMPRWLVPVVLIGLVGAGVAFTDRTPSDRPVAAPSASPSPSPSAPASPLPDPGTAGSACGGDVSLPTSDPGPAPQGTGLRMLVGDRDLRVVDVDAASVHVLTTLEKPMTGLARYGNRIVAVLQDRCSPDGYGRGVIATVDARTGATSHEESGDELVPGLPPTVIDDDIEGNGGLRDLGGDGLTMIPRGWRVLARHGSSYAVHVDAPAAAGEGAIGTIGLGTPANGRLTKEYGAGTEIAASGNNTVWLAGGCDPGPCLLAASGADGVATARPLDGRYAWGGALSPDGRRVAFRLARKEGRLGGHPGPPNDVAVADLRTGSLTVLPGLVLPPKSGLTLTWSADNWLAIGTDLGTRTQLLLWQEGMERPGEVPLPPTGGGTTGPPALLFLDQSR